MSLILISLLLKYNFTKKNTAENISVRDLTDHDALGLSAYFAP